MGSPVSVVVAKVAMQNIEEQARATYGERLPPSLKTSHIIDLDSATGLTRSTDYHQRVTLEQTLEQTALNRSQPLLAPYKRLP